MGFYTEPASDETVIVTNGVEPFPRLPQRCNPNKHSAFADKKRQDILSRSSIELSHECGMSESDRQFLLGRQVCYH